MRCLVRPSSLAWPGCGLVFSCCHTSCCSHTHLNPLSDLPPSVQMARSRYAGWLPRFHLSPALHAPSRALSFEEERERAGVVRRRREGTRVESNQSATVSPTRSPLAAGWSCVLTCGCCESTAFVTVPAVVVVLVVAAVDFAGLGSVEVEGVSFFVLFGVSVSVSLVWSEGVGFKEFVVGDDSVVLVVCASGAFLTVSDFSTPSTLVAPVVAG